MAEAEQYTFTFKEIAELLVKKQGIHDGIWGISVTFGLKGMNVGPSDDSLLPTAMVPIAKLGITKVQELNNLSVDAATVNPRKPSPAKKK